MYYGNYHILCKQQRIQFGCIGRWMLQKCGLWTELSDNRFQNHLFLRMTTVEFLFFCEWLRWWYFDFSLSVTGGNMLLSTHPNPLLASDVCSGIGKHTIYFRSAASWLQPVCSIPWWSAHFFSWMPNLPWLSGQKERLIFVLVIYWSLAQKFVMNHLFSKQIRVTRNSTAKGYTKSLWSALFPFCG